MPTTHTHYKTAKTFDFPGDITLRILLTGEETDGAQEVFEDIVQSGVGPGRHIHHDQDETFFFLEGDFIVEIDGVVHEMSPGDVAFIPRGSIHAFKNVGESEGRLRYIFSPALKMEAMFRAFHEAAQGGEITETQMTDIASAYGQTFVGPPL
jgi:mannose-6-phosphate isomerase-like protein (cupin superfamily)